MIREFGIETIRLPIGRPFSWRALGIIVALQVVGNLVSIPMLRFENASTEPLYVWILVAAASAIVIGLALILGGRTGLGAPLLEGYLKDGKFSAWFRRVFALSLLFAVAAIPYIIFVNLDLEPGSYPAIWKPILASVDAGVQEESSSGCS